MARLPMVIHSTNATFADSAVMCPWGPECLTPRADGPVVVLVLAFAAVQV